LSRLTEARSGRLELPTF